MNSSLHEMTRDIQARIRELAYLMWESAGRQQGMAVEYWLKAETEVMSTLQAAAERMMSGSVSSAKPAASSEKPAEVSAKVPAPAAAPVLNAPIPEATFSEPPAAAPLGTQPKPAARTSTAPAAAKPAARKPAPRTKKS